MSCTAIPSVFSESLTTGLPYGVAAHNRARTCSSNSASGFSSISCTHSSMTAPRSASRSEEHTSELQSLMRISYAVFCLKKKKNKHKNTQKYIKLHDNIPKYEVL